MNAPTHLSVSALAFVAGVTGGGSLAPAQVPDGYEMVVIRTTEGIPSWPEINDQSQVVWSESYAPGTSNIFMYDGGEIVQLTDGSHYDLRPAMNSNEMLVWSRGMNWTPPFELVLKVGDSFVDIPGDPTSFGQARINNNGWVAWYQDMSPKGDGTVVEVFLFDGQRVVQISDNGYSNQGVHINSQGEITWTKYNFNVNPWVGTIMLYADGGIHELTDGTSQCQGVGLNDLGQVVWNCGPTHTVMMWDKGKLTVLFENGRSPRINNIGDIAFGRWDDELGRWDNWLFKVGVFYDLPDLGYSVPGGIINEHSEVVARVLDVEPGVNAILMLRRCEPGTGPVCVDDTECGEELCTTGDCDCGHCAFMPRLYGDVNQDGGVDLQDIVCILDGFGGEFTGCSFDRLDIGGCMADGIIDLLDILGVLDAFSDEQACCP